MLRDLLCHASMKGKPVVLIANKVERLGGAEASSSAIRALPRQLGVEDAVAQGIVSLGGACTALGSATTDGQIDGRMREYVAKLGRLVLEKQDMLEAKVAVDTEAFKASRAVEHAATAARVAKIKADRAAGIEVAKGPVQQAGPITCSACGERPAVRKSAALRWKPGCDECIAKAIAERDAKAQAEKLEAELVVRGGGDGGNVDEDSDVDLAGMGDSRRRGRDEDIPGGLQEDEQPPSSGGFLSGNAMAKEARGLWGSVRCEASPRRLMEAAQPVDMSMASVEGRWGGNGVAASSQNTVWNVPRALSRGSRAQCRTTVTLPARTFDLDRSSTQLLFMQQGTVPFLDKGDKEDQGNEGVAGIMFWG